MQLNFSSEVREARESGRPLVALESSVIAQGLPYPHNLDAARRCEAAVRSAGAIPATLALWEGEVRVGLSDDALQALAAGAMPRMKVGSRDLAIAVARGATGGTTVSATCEIAAAAGIRVFATGGIGGVHRGFAEHLDVSQDLWALSRFPVAVVCAGAKSVLDLPGTLELLESLAVPVLGVGTHAFPAFFSRDSGLTLEHSVADAQDAARILHARFEALGQGGALLALPPPEATAIDAAEIEGHLSAALAAASAAGVSGKDVTPYLLGEIARRTEGRSRIANLALLENNARFAGELAVALAAV